MWIHTEHWAYAAALATGMIFGCAMSELDDDDGVVAELCEADLEDPGCDLCLKTACCQTYTLCVNEPDCNCVLGCANSGASREDCEGRCNIDTGRVSEVVALLTGDDEACDVQCGDRCRAFALPDEL